MKSYCGVRDPVFSSSCLLKTVKHAWAQFMAKATGIVGEFLDKSRTPRTCIVRVDRDGIEGLGLDRTCSLRKEKLWLRDSCSGVIKHACTSLASA